MAEPEYQYQNWIGYLPSTWGKLYRLLSNGNLASSAELDLVIQVAFNLAARNCKCFPFVASKYDYVNMIPEQLYYDLSLDIHIQQLEPAIYKLLMSVRPEPMYDTCELVSLDIKRGGWVLVSWRY